MSTFYLIRHGNNDLVGKRIAGWLPGVHLNEEGRRQAARLAEILADKPISRIFSSPLDRTRETAAPLAARLKLEPETSDRLGEIHFGDWQGQPLEKLAESSEWRRWHSFRAAVRPPNGEMIVEAQSRMVAQIQELRAKFPGEHIALFSHGDPIRSALIYFLGVPIDFILRVEISPGSVSVLSLSDHGAQILSLNDTSSSH